MSKEKIEVGDIWKHKQSGFIFYISNLDEKTAWISMIWENGYVDKQWYGGFFYERNIYLGKSQANINDLFKTENEK